MKRILKQPAWLLVLTGWVLFLGSHASLALLGGMMDRVRCPDGLAIGLLFPAEGLAVVCAFALVVLGSWRMAARIPYKLISVALCLVALGIQTYLGLLYFVFAGLFLYFKAAGHGM